MTRWTRIRRPQSTLGPALITLAVLVSGCPGREVRQSVESCVEDGSDQRSGAHDLPIHLPERSEWVDRGEIFAAGEKGAWDHYLYGGFAGAVVKKDGRFFLYYQGARGYSERYGTVTDRAIGVASSADGVDFTKHAGNPVLRWSPREWLEEGAVSAGATLDSAARVVLVYGANTSINDWLVDADGRVAMSTNGFDFHDVGVALDHGNRHLWGSGDEVFPVITIEHDSNVYVYYIPNGNAESGKLGVAWGSTWSDLRSSTEVADSRGQVEVWGMAGHAHLGEGTYALFLNNARTGCMEVRTVRLDRPHLVSPPLRRYAFADFSQGTVFLDHDSQTWYLFHRTDGAKAYRVKVAPVRVKDVS